jgi:hypothetical protein
MEKPMAAGPKTDTQERRERIAASLEAQLHACRRETDIYLTTYRTETGVLYYSRVDDVVKLMRATAQLANVIARLDAVKNRGSIPQ